MQDLIIQEGRRLLGSKTLFYPIFKIKSPKNLINRTTQIVIEGAPSSGNSYAYKAFTIAQPKPLNIAHHKHLPIQIILAYKWGIPCLVLIRKPLDAVCSFLSRYNLKIDSVESRIRFYYILNYWLSFYETIYSYRNQFILCEFNQLIHNYCSTIERLNSFYKTTFSIPNNESCATVLNQLDLPVKPNRKRSNLKYELMNWALSQKKFKNKIEVANYLYSKFITDSA